VKDKSYYSITVLFMLETTCGNIKERFKQIKFNLVLIGLDHGNTVLHERTLIRDFIITVSVINGVYSLL